ncbi:MAG: ATP-binding cassette domain-containing protein [Pseudomonadota bacterium]
MSSANQPVIEFERVTLSVFGRRLARNIALSGFSREAVGIVAQSGFGKTSLFRAMFGVEGYKLDGGYNFDQDSAGYVPQRGGLVPWLTLEENSEVLLNASNFAPPESLDLSHLGKRKATELSGGEYQRAVLWIGVESARKCLVLDEPFTSVDIKRKEQCIQYLIERMKSRDNCVIVSSHDINFLYNVCDKIFILRQESSHPIFVNDIKSETELKNIILNIF